MLIVSGEQDTTLYGCFISEGTQRPNETTICQKCLKQFSLSFESLSGKFGAALKTIYLFQMIGGTLV